MLKARHTILKLLVRSQNAYCTKNSGSYLYKHFPGVPHPPKDPPSNYNPTELNTEMFSAPENVQLLVFRPLKKCEVLGPRAGKLNEYKNPEYFAYHRYSFVDLQRNAMRIGMEKLCQEALIENEEEECECNDKGHECGDTTGEDCESGTIEDSNGNECKIN